MIFLSAFWCTLSQLEMSTLSSRIPAEPGLHPPLPHPAGAGTDPLRTPAGVQTCQVTPRDGRQTGGPR